MTADEIRKAVDEGKTVHCGNKMYTVIKDELNQYMIMYGNKQHFIGLTWSDNQTLNGKPEEFYIEEEAVEK